MNEEEANKKPSFGLEDLRDLVALGLGAPNLGTFEGEVSCSRVPPRSSIL